MSPQGRPKGETRGAQHEGTPVGFWWSHVPQSRLPGWIEQLLARLEAGAHGVFVDNAYVQASNLPITRTYSQGNTCPLRTLDDGSVPEVSKNFPTREQAFAAAGPRALDAQWIAFDHCWILSCRLA